MGFGKMCTKRPEKVKGAEIRSSQISFERKKCKSNIKHGSRISDIVHMKAHRYPLLSKQLGMILALMMASRHRPRFRSKL